MFPESSTFSNIPHNFTRRPGCEHEIAEYLIMYCVQTILTLTHNVSFGVKLENYQALVVAQTGLFL